MLYRLIGLLQRITFRIFFKHIHLANLNYIPFNKPVVIACNHPGAFMDPGFIGSMLRKPIYYTARGDVFANPVASFFLHALHIKPVFRLEEGFGNLSKNYETINALADVLKKNGIVLIFSEGMSALDRRLRPLRKGTARIFLQIALENDLDIELYASGITYTHKKNFRQSVMYSVSKPLFLKDYLTDFISHQQRGYHTFSKELARRISENFVVVKYPECDEIVDQHINYYCSTENLPQIPMIVQNRRKLDALQSLSSQINNLFRNEPNRFEKLKAETSQYESMLDQYKITDYGLVNKLLNPFQILLLIFAFPFSLLGFYFWGIPYIIAKKIADKTVTRIDFYDSVAMNSLAFIYAIIMVFNNIILALWMGWWSLLIWVFAPVLGEFAFWTYDAIVHLWRVVKAQNCPVQKELLDLRRKIANFHAETAS